MRLGITVHKLLLGSNRKIVGSTASALIRQLLQVLKRHDGVKFDSKGPDTFGALQLGLRRPQRDPKDFVRRFRILPGRYLGPFALRTIVADMGLNK